MVMSRSSLLLQMVLVASLACGCGDDLVVSAKTSQGLTVTRDGDDTLRFGASIARVGDLNDDGFQDVVIGAPSEGDGAGQVYLLLGDEHPVANAELLPFDEEHAEGDGFGVAVTGLSEDSCEGPIASLIAVGTAAFDPDGTTSSTGEIELYRAQVASGQVDIAYTGSVVGEELVSLDDVVPVAADVFGEGVQALLVGNSTYRDPADEVYESGVVLAYSIDYQTASASDPESVYGEATKDSLGRSLVPVGDLDGDGNVDLAAGTSTGKVYLIFGNSEGGLDAIPFSLVDLDTTDQVQTAAVKLTSPENADSGSGDEGGRLLVLSRSGCDAQVALTGQEYLVEVDSNREVSVDTTASPISVADHTSCDDLHISASAGADLDLDGESDVVVGAAGSDTMGGAKLLFGANGTPFKGGLGTGGGGRRAGLGRRHGRGR